MPEFCGHGGFCLHIAGQDGAHTRTPMPGTRDWDLEHARQRYEASVLAGLDFPAPPWADLLDPE